MRRLVPFLAALPLALICSGCVYSLGVSLPTPVQMRVASSQPQQHVVRVTRGEQADFPVAPDGAVTFTVPGGYSDCSVYLFGVVEVSDGSGEGVPVVELRRDERVVRKLSLRQIAKLPADEAGFRVVRLKD
jgi:hypothetical protein